MKQPVYQSRVRRAGAYLALLILLNACRSNDQQEAALQVFAASSLAAPLQEVARTFEQQTGIRVKLNLAASSFLAKQIEQHAPAGVFISASPEWTRYLVTRGVIDSTKIVAIATNQLVIIVPAGASEQPHRLNDLLRPQFSSIAVGDPSHVPVGIYAKAVLQRAGLWHQLQPKILPTLEAAATLAVIGRGEAPVGIAYRSELYGRDDVQLAFALPDSLQPEILYTAAIPATAAEPISAQAFIDFLLADEGQQILTQFQLGTVIRGE